VNCAALRPLPPKWENAPPSRDSPPLIQFRQLTLTRGVRRLIEDASLQIHAGWRVGVVGANGSGKSSLFALLRGEIQSEAGDCLVPRDWRVASVAQETPPLPQAAIEFVLDGDEELRRVERAIAAADAAQNCTSGSKRSTVTAPRPGPPPCLRVSASRRRISSGRSPISQAAGACA